MKKVIIVSILVLAIMLSLVACGGGSTTQSSSSSNVQPSSNAANSVIEEAIEAASSIIDNASEKESSAPEVTPSAQAGDKEVIVFEEQTVVDNDDCVIRITGIDPDNIWGYTLKAIIENKSADSTYMFSIMSGAVNGVSYDPLFVKEVAPGKKANEDISFSNDDLDKTIGEFTDIELTFRVYDSDNWSADDIAKETVHIYPFGEEKATLFVREAQPTDTVVVENDDISIVVINYEEDSIWGYMANLYLINKTDKNLMFSADDVSVNGFMCEPFWATSVGSGKSAFSSVSWSSSSFEDNGITHVDEIEMTINVYDYDNWSADSVFKDTITLNP